MNKQELELRLIEDVAGYTHDPLGFVHYAYPWGEGELVGHNEPFEWQKNILGIIGKHLQDPKTRHQPLKVAVVSGKGIGKSALISMIFDWAMSTCEDCKVVVTAGTGDQLNTKTAPEVAKWTRMLINNHWWNVNATSIRVKDVKHQSTWRGDFLTWSEENPQAFAGLHNKGKRIVVIFDEASAIADVIWERAEGAMTDEGTEIIWIAFGNPEKNTGRFRECFGKFKHRWHNFQIDSRSVECTNKEEIQRMAEDFGEDSDYFRVLVKGEFPRASAKQLIPSDVVEMCRKYKAVGYEKLPKVISCDVARFGDDQTVIGLRQGRKFKILGKYRGLDTVQVAGKIIQFINSESSDAVVVDGDGIGAGVVDQLKARGFSYRLFEFHGGSKADDAEAYFNKRAEAWGLMANSLKEGMEIPNDPELADDLTGPEYRNSTKMQIQLERKEDMKKRGLKSPDCGDCLAMSFSVQIGIRRENHIPNYSSMPVSAGGWMM